MLGTHIVIVGAGPVGLALANFMGQAGVRTTVLEREDTTSDEPRAVNLDDESMRTLQSLGFDQLLADTLLPAVGTMYLSPSGRPIAYAHPKIRPHGHWPKNVFVQPDFDALLAKEAGALDDVTVRFGTELIGLHQTSQSVTLEVSGGSGPTTIEADWVIGCDGGRSTVRSSIGVEMGGTSFEQPWIVIDVLDDPHRVRYSRHHLDPQRPHVVVPGRSGRCRYEFMLLPHEDPSEMLTWESIERLLAPYRRVTPAQMIRSTVYSFHALSAQRWRVGRVLLAGDAAHMMPPMAGQGLNTGLRDARNLSWKLEHVAKGLASPKLLDTYEAERKPHAEAMIRLSTRMGRILMTTSSTKARCYRSLFAASKLLPPLNRYISEMRFKPPAAYRRGFMQGPRRKSWVGRLLPQPIVMEPDGRFVAFDHVLGHGFALLAVDTGLEPLERFEAPTFDTIMARRVHVAFGDVNPLPDTAAVASVADVDERLANFLSSHVGEVLLVRPDRYVAAACRVDRPDELGSWLRHALGQATPAVPAHQPPTALGVPDVKPGG